MKGDRERILGELKELMEWIDEEDERLQEAYGAEISASLWDKIYVIEAVVEGVSEGFRGFLMKRQKEGWYI